MNLRYSIFFLYALLLGPAGLYAQAGSCETTAVPAVVRAEGLTERVGDILLTCAGAPDTVVTGNLSVFLSWPVTNRLLSDSGILDVGLSVNGAIANVQATLGSANQVTFSGLRIPFNTSGSAGIRLSNIRVNATSALSGQSLFPQPIVAQVAFNPTAGGLSATQSTVQVAVPARGLYATRTPPVVPSHAGSALPDMITFEELIRKQTMFFSTRITEGFQTAFEPPQAGVQGTRVMLRFSGFPSDARLFVPNGIAGSTAAVPTSAGDFGGSVSGGSYLSGSGTLLLSRVVGTDQNGSGGSPLPLEQGGSATTLNGMSEVSLNNGAGVAVYEVRDANATVRQESAQIPVFMGIARSESARSVTAQVEVTFAPVSTSFNASAADPVPRFVRIPAESDCGVFRDCDSYIPKLNAPPVNMDFRLVRGVGTDYRVIPLGNDGGGLMPWAARVEYKRGSGWILFDRESANQPVAVRVVVRALTEMQAGIYEATIVIDAGAAGVARYPVRLEVVEPQVTPPPTPRPTVSEVVHGATFQNVPVGRGALVTILGTNLAGSNVSVTFDGKPARILYTSSDQINLQVPSDLPGNTAQVVVTVNGTASDAKIVQVRAAYPGIFEPGILNQDGSVNSPTNPANAGSYVQIFATGLLAPDGSGVVDAKLHDVMMTNLPYAGPAPGLPGVQQVNLRVPEYFPTMTTEVLLCTTAAGQRDCSRPVRIHVRQTL